MSGTAVLLCSGTAVAAAAASGRPAAVIDDLCTNPASAAAALRELGATRVVLGLCERPSHDLVTALRRAGAQPFGIEPVLLDGRGPAVALIAGAAAKLEALPADETGRPALAAAGISRRALFSRSGVLTDMPTAVLDPSRCIGTARCGLCVDACRARAMDGEGALPVVDASACSACAACVTACPSGALRLAGASAAQLEAQLERLLPFADGVLFTCTHADADTPSGWVRIELPTLGLVTAGWILQARSRGVDARLAACERCRARATEMEAFAALVLPGPAPSQAAPTTPLALTEPAATVDAAARLARHGRKAIAHAASPLGVVSLAADRCTLCGACTVACPTEALRLDETEAETVLAHRPALCVGCGRCVGSCPEGALGVDRGIDLERLEHPELALLRAEREACRRCGASLPPLPLGRRVRELLPAVAGAPLDLCTACAAQDQPHERTKGD